jgi:hypothetical protein
MAFSKLASLKIENPEITLNNWVGSAFKNKRTASNKLVDYQKIISNFNPDEYLLTHCTIVASVDVEEAPKPVHFASMKTEREYEQLKGKKDYFVSPETSKYMNANGDCWSRELLKNSYRTFIGAENYVEHVQDPALSKGKILDAVLREVDDKKSLFVDILVATNKKHSDLVSKIKTGKLTTLSMGAIVAFTVCTKCGRVASDETELCNDIRFFKKNSFISETDGKKRVIAELCGHFLYPESNKFIEGSWVETPAFKGAVMRNEILLGEEEKELFAAKYEPVANLKSENLKDSAQRILNAFALVDKVQSAFITEGKNEDIDEAIDEIAEDDKKEEETEEDAPAEEEKKKEDKGEGEGELTEDAPPEEEESVEEEVPEELKDLGEPPEGEEGPEDEALEEEAEKPYKILKEEIKNDLKQQIKKELLKDLGIDIEEESSRVPTLQDVDLNDNVIQSSLRRNFNTLRKASTIIKNQGMKGLLKNGFSQRDVLKIAFISNKYSINKDIYKILGDFDILKFPTFRRCAKSVESKLKRPLTAKERESLDKLLKDAFF